MSSSILFLITQTFVCILFETKTSGKGSRSGLLVVLIKIWKLVFFSNFNFCVEKKSFCAARFEIVLNAFLSRFEYYLINFIDFLQKSELGVTIKPWNPWASEKKMMGTLGHLNKHLVKFLLSGKGKIVEIDESHFAKVKHSKGTFQSYPHMETISIKESDFLANGTDSDHEENCESEFEEVGVAIWKLSLNPTK
ncbi:hypothetical protein BpHYR1_050089 [Brachionus plicatilis]|uniref:Uncharacterized protein n=1 Tax=Brachionus plicatilis TaxID=10195 RepID=A0A3M7QVW5_BRAPC|nr:hypothetical protein BpHYR1_050089 [Brachionus plicatilis]